MKTLFTALTIFLCSATLLFAQNEEPRADRLNDILKSDILNVGFLFQTDAAFSFEDDDFLGGRQFGLGANRVDLRGTVDNNFTYRVQMQLSGSTRLLDAQLGYRFSDQLRIVTGAFKPFLSVDLDPSPGATDFINRARHVGTMVNSREVGITILGESEGLNYRFGMYNGTGLALENDNTFFYTARVGYEAETENGIFNVGFNGGFNQTELERVSNTGLTSEGDRLLYGGFIEYDSPVVFGTAEFLQTAFDAQDYSGNEEKITGFFATLGVNISEKDQLLARWDYLTYDIRDYESDQLILGWNHQATSLISFQVNFISQFDNDEDGQYGLLGVFQFQI